MLRSGSVKEQPMTGLAVALAQHAMAAGICSGCGMRQSRDTVHREKSKKLSEAGHWRSPEALNGGLTSSNPSCRPPAPSPGGALQALYSSAFSLSPSSGPIHSLPLWGAAGSEPALAVFSDQNSLHLNLPSDELSLNSALKAPLAFVHNVCIPILMLP